MMLSHHSHHVRMHDNMTTNASAVCVHQTDACIQPHRQAYLARAPRSAAVALVPVHACTPVTRERVSEIVSDVVPVSPRLAAPHR